MKRINNPFSNDKLIKEDGTVNWKNLTIEMVLFLIIFFILYIIVLKLLKSFDFTKNIENFVLHFGLWGVSLLTLFIDTFIVPFSMDIVFPFVQKWNIPVLIICLSISSTIAGCLGYWIGRLLGKLKIIQLLTENFSEKGKRLIQHYGAWAVVIAAITPIPFSTVCWLSGMVEVKFSRVALASCTRIFRVALYFLIIRGSVKFAI